MTFVAEFDKLAKSESLLSSVAPPQESPYHQQEAEAFSALSLMAEPVTISPAGTLGTIPKFTGVSTIGNSIAKEVAGSIVIGVDPPGGAELLRVGGGARLTSPLTINSAVASGANINLFAGGRIDMRFQDSAAPANEQIWDLSVDGVAGAGSFALVARNDAGVAGGQVFRAFRAGGGSTITSVDLGFSGTIVNVGNNATSVRVGTDPGGPQFFRVGGSARINGATEVMTGGLTVTAGDFRVIAGTAAIGTGNIPSTAIGLGMYSALTGSTFQFGIQVQPTFDSGATSQGRGISVQTSTAAAAFTMGSIYGIVIHDPIKGAGSIITTQFGIWIETQTKGVTNYAIWTDGAGLISLGDDLQLRPAVSRIRPGATSFAIRNNANSADNLIIADAGTATFRNFVRIDTAARSGLQFKIGGVTTATFDSAVADVVRLVDSTDLIIGFQFVVGNAARIVPGPTSLSFRNNANSADNLLILDSGAIAARNTITVSAGDVVVAAGSFVLQTAVSRIIPGATSLALRNNANSADNLLITDLGVITVRSDLSIGGNAVFTTAATRIIPGATSLSLRNNANNADNLILTDAGLATFRNTVALTSGSINIPTSGGYQFAGVNAVTTSANYHEYRRKDGGVGLFLGGAADQGSYYDNDSHHFRTTAAFGSEYLLLASTGIIVTGVSISTNNYIDQTEMAAPGTPAANKTRIYTKDKAGVSELFYKNDAGTERDLSVSGLRLIDTQTFTATGAGTWNKPAGAVLVRVVIIGAGGGGGGGRGGAASSTRQGGTGAGGGACSESIYNAVDLGGTEALSVGVGGTLGAGGNSADGANGGIGGDSWFGNAAQASAKQWAYGGGGGAGGGSATAKSGGSGGGILSAGAVGTVTTGVAGGGPSATLAAGVVTHGQGYGGAGSEVSSAGGAAAFGGAAGAGINATVSLTGFDGGVSQRGGGGGGSGGGVIASNVGLNGGVGGDNDVGLSGGGGAAGTGGVVGAAGAAGAAGDNFRAGQGGGGGGGDTNSVAGNGGAGGIPAGGGGGGGGGTTIGGDGGAGGRGEIRVYSYA